MSENTERRHVEIDGATIEVIVGGVASSRPLVGAAHPTCFRRADG
jgi:hypothetical protein